MNRCTNTNESLHGCSILPEDVHEAGTISREIISNYVTGDNT